MCHEVRALSSIVKIHVETLVKERKMKTLFELREKTASTFYEDIQNLFDEPLKIIKLGDQSINACLGCWNCWLKTPGKCVMKGFLIH